ncbi:MAG: hypothetical protein IAE95_03200 [Chitinophagaceae bacterium]|nr:hypothetical protein [Chitinophagaceae bacterium]
MSERNRYMMFAGMGVGCISSIYFLSLLMGLPLLLAAPATLTVLFLLGKWLIPATTISEVQAEGAAKQQWISLVLLAAGVAGLAITGPAMAPKYGGWDAWTIWNLHARTLTDAENWRKMFQNVTNGHPDYPLALPATLAFFMRLFSSADGYMIPFVFSMFVAISIPVVVYNEIERKSLPVAAVILALFVVEAYYIINSTTQYADALLSFFLLSALVCVQYARDNYKLLMAAVVFAGLCVWTKNEGAVLAAIFMVIYAPVFFSRSALRFTLPAMAVPLLMVVIFKLVCPVQNDLVRDTGGDSFSLLLQRERWGVVFDFFADVFNQRLAYSRWIVAVYLVLCAVTKRLPSKRFLLVLVSVFAYFLVYVVTPKDLTWHLSTSAERLLFQLFPVLLYAMGMDVAEVDLPYLNRTKTDAPAVSE